MAIGEATTAKETNALATHMHLAATLQWHFTDRLSANFKHRSWVVFSIVFMTPARFTLVIYRPSSRHDG